MKPKPEFKRVHVLLTTAQLKAINHIAQKTNRTRSDVVRVIIKEYLDAQ